MAQVPAPAKTVHRRKDARPSEILDAAASVFAQYGFAATNLERVAELAQVSKGTIYRYFEDKDVLFARVIEAKIFTPLQNAPPLNFPLAGTAGQTLRQALSFAYVQGKQSRLADLVLVLVLEGERFADLRKAWLDRLITIASATMRTLMEKFDQGGNLRASRYYANPEILFFPIICAIALHGEMARIDGFDMDAFVEAQLDLVCGALDRV
jgi:AcrR family transcriptional regulator